MSNETVQTSPPGKKIFALIIALLAFASIGIQYYYTELSTLDFVSYFTTLCNLLIALTLTFATLIPQKEIGKWSSSLSVQSAVAIYIFIVGLVYNIALRGLWKNEGLLWVLDNMVHVVVPVLYIIYWIIFRSAGTLKWKDGLIWLLFPLLYLTYSLVRGAMIDWYPYPFLNVIKFGYGQVILNIIIMLVVFLGAGLLLIRITHGSKKN